MLVGPEPGENAGQIWDPQGVAVDQATGTIYIADRNNFRIDEFDPKGDFLLAFGNGVRTGAPELQTCTATTGCRRGPEGNNQLDTQSVAVEQASGDVFVGGGGGTDSLSKYTAAGEFLLVLGGEVNRTAVTKRQEEEAKSEPVTVTRQAEDLCTAADVAAGGSCGSGSRSANPGALDGSERTPLAIDAEGHLWLGDVDRIEEFGSAGEFLREVPLPGAGQVEALAVDAFGDLYVESSQVAGVRKLEPDGTVLYTVDAAGHPNALTLDPANGNLFVSDQETSAGSAVATLLEYDSTGLQVAAFGAGEVAGQPRGNALAFDAALGGLLAVSGVNEPSAVQSLPLPSPGPLVQPGSAEASTVSKTGATLNAIVNPENAQTTYHFQYVDQHSFEVEGGFSSPHTVTTPESASIGEGFEAHPVSFEIAAGKLTPGVVYRFRVVATNANAPGGVDGETVSFEALPPARIDSLSASDVASTSATLEAAINPLGDETTYQFEYLTEAQYQANGEGFSGVAGADVVPQSEESIGAGEQDVVVGNHVQGLDQSTTYWYRVVTHNGSGVEAGVGHAFTTEGAGSSLVLPDGRQWEMVSPPDKHGALLTSIGESSLLKAAAAGGALTYQAWHPTEADPPGFPLYEQVFSVRDGGEWATRDISTAYELPAGATGAEGPEYKFFSEDLSLGLVEPLGPYAPLAPHGSPPDTERTEYIRRDSTCESEPADCYEPLLTGAPGYADVPAGTAFSGERVTRPGENQPRSSEASFVTATPDLAHVLLGSSIQLSSVSSRGGLYEWTASAPPAQKLQLVSALPDGEPVTEYSLGSLRNVISANGSRVFWAKLLNSEPAALYMRNMAKGETMRLDTVQPGASGLGAPAPVWGAAATDGSKAFFTDSQHLTSDAGGSRGVPDLYECAVVEASERSSCELTDLTPPNGRENAGVSSVVGVSENGEWVYFTADGVLAPGARPTSCPRQGSEGTCNLYVSHAGRTSLIAVLSGADYNDWAESLGNMTARVAPNGEWLAFMSLRDLTGYDNRDAASGQPDEEVYLYHASTDGPGRLVCASCNPTGARPLGIEYAELDEGHSVAGGDRVWSATAWIAASVPGWTNKWYQSRYLSDEGRLFFNSSDALVPQDINGTEDVYEYEPAGVGNCVSASATYGAASGGCVGLISSGTSAAESGFIDASEGGGDVFFLTSQRLSPQDFDTALDVYDAHVCNAQVPCVARPASSPPCETADACRVAPEAQPPVFGAPASATFSGAGNVTPSTLPTVVAKTLTRAQKLARALGACHTSRTRKRRAACERTVRRRYATEPRGKRIGGKHGKTVSSEREAN
jgi:hypothetical protein